MVRPTPVRAGEEYALAWLSLVNISLITLVVTTWQLQAQTETAIQTAQQKAVDSCLELNAAAKQLLNIPDLMYQHALEASKLAIESLKHDLIVAIDAVQGIILWALAIYKSTYRCLLGLAVNGAVEAVTLLAKPFQQAAETVVDGVHQGIDMIEAGLGAITGANQESLESTSRHPSTYLGNWTDSMLQVQRKVEQWTTSDDTLDNLVRIPFQALKQQINESFTDWSPAPINFTTPAAAVKRDTPLQLCDTADIDSIFDHVQFRLQRFTVIVIVVLLLAVVISTLINIVYIRHRHRYLQQQCHALSLQFASNGPEKVYTIERHLQLVGHAHRKPVISYLLANIKARSSPFVGPKPWRMTLAWWLDYMSHPMAVYCFVVGLFGIVITLILRTVLDGTMNSLAIEYSNRVNDWTAHVVDKTAGELLVRSNTSVAHINDWISATESDINDHAFKLVVSSVTALNSTLGAVSDSLSQFVNITLGGTVLEKPVQGTLACLVLNKIERVEHGLTWLAENTKVQLPPFNLSAATSLAAYTPNQDLVQNAWSSLHQDLQRQLTYGLRYYWVLLGLWFLCCFIGLVFNFVWIFRRNKTVNV